MSLLPIAVAVAAGIGLGVIAWSPRPRVGIIATTTVAALISAAVLTIVSATAIAFLLGPAQRAQFVAWCRILPLHHEVGLAEGLGSILVLAWVTGNAGRILWARRAAGAGTAGRRLSVRASDRPFAYAVPGRPGCVVVSTGLLSALKPRERQVVFAHERAHLVARHDRHLLVAALADAIVPVLRPLTARLRLATERAADEEAVLAMGGDRRIVASAIAKAALSGDAYQRTALPAFGRNGVVARVSSLIGPTPGPVQRRAGAVISLFGAAMVLIATAVQAHGLATLAVHICVG